MASKDLSGLYIELAPFALPAFSEKTSYWLDYEALQAEKISTLRVVPVISACHMSGQNLIWIDCHIEDDAFCGNRHGLPYGDREFERELGSYLPKVLLNPDLTPIQYTEQGRQREDMISLEAGYEWSVFFETISHHRLLELAGSAQITALQVGPLSWGTSTYHPG